VNSVLYSVHSSGHPSKQELRLMLKLINPKYFMPIHGEYRMLKIHGQIAESLGMPKDNVFIMNNGDVIQLLKHKVKSVPGFQCEPIYIDGRDISGLDDAVIQDREKLKHEGLVSIIVGINSKEGKIITEPIVVSKAFAFDDKIENDIRDIVTEILNRIVNNHATFGQIKTAIKNEVGQYIKRKTEREPIVVPVVMDKIQ
jgi:ribonuclease J